jgi:phenylacetate-CoA ligase
MYATLYRTLRLLSPGGMQTRKLLKEMERSQWMSREELNSIQLLKIQRLVKYAYENIPYYNKLYKSLDIHPEDIKTLKDFQALPFITKEQIINNLHALVSPTLRDKLSIMETGGSTGMPLRCYIDGQYWIWNSAFEWLGRGWYDLKEGDKAAWFWGSLRDIPDQGLITRVKAQIKRQRYFNVLYITKARFEAFAEMLVQWQPAMFIGYPSSIYLFAKYVREQGITGIHPKFIEVTSEKLMDSQRQLMEDVFQCKVADAYGSREIGSVAIECEAGQLHVTEGCHMEIIANGQAAQPGQTGEIVLTSLHQYGMPMIRYRIMDTAVYQSGPCSCGRGLPAFHEITGRTTSFIVTADGQYTDESFFEYIFQAKTEVARYQVYQPDLEHLQIRLVLRQKVEQAWFDNLKKNLQVPFGSRLRISIQLVDEIPLTTAGKLLSVISDVPTDFI